MSDGPTRRQRPGSGPSRPRPEDEVLTELREAVELVAAERPTTAKPRLPLGVRRGPRRDRPPLDRACLQLLEIVRRRCPELLPTDPLEPSQTAPPVPVDPEESRALLTLAARQAVLSAAGRPVPPDDDRLPSVVLWQEGTDELLVDVAAIRVALGDGHLTVAVPVRCDQVLRQRAVVQVVFVVGTPQRPTGLLAATSVPLGPAVVVRRWGDALTALAWQAVLDAVGGVAAVTGSDQDGNPLVPVAVTASSDGLAVQAQARHPVDRVLAGRVVSPVPTPLPSSGAFESS